MGKQYWWFPQRGDRRARRLAKAICATCPVRRECATLALELRAGGRRQLTGVWAGCGASDVAGLRRAAMQTDAPAR
jgi:hypothetical protein